jgi:hypothetical protein
VIPDDGGGSAPGPAGPQTLKVEPSSIPGARDAFHEAADKIDKLVLHLAGLNTQPWAGDPVSTETATQFDTGSAGAADMGKDAALDALRKYGEQLRGSATSLNDAYVRYVNVEGANTAKWKGKPVGA